MLKAGQSWVVVLSEFKEWIEEELGVYIGDVEDLQVIRCFEVNGIDRMYPKCTLHVGSVLTDCL